MSELVCNSQGDNPWNPAQEASESPNGANDGCDAIRIRSPRWGSATLSDPTRGCHPWLLTLTPLGSEPCFSGTLYEQRRLYDVPKQCATSKLTLRVTEKVDHVHPSIARSHSGPRGKAEQCACPEPARNDLDPTVIRAAVSPEVSERAGRRFLLSDRTLSRVLDRGTGRSCIHDPSRSPGSARFLKGGGEKRTNPPASVHLQYPRS